MNMADYFSPSVVTPSLPAIVMTQAVRDLASHFGIGTEADFDDTVYCFSEERFDEPSLDDDEFEQLRKDDPELAKWMSENDAHAFDFLQHLLQRCPSDLQELVVTGSFTCNKMRPDGWGGWIARITRETIQTGDTGELLRCMRKEDPLLTALETVVALAKPSVLRHPAEGDVDDVMVDQARRQGNAVAVVEDYVVNHGPARFS